MDRAPATSPIWAPGLMVVSWLYWKKGTEPWWSSASLDSPLPVHGQDVPQEGLAHGQGAGRWMWGQAVPQGPIPHHALCPALLSCPEPVPRKAGLPQCPQLEAWWDTAEGQDRCVPAERPWLASRGTVGREADREVAVGRGVEQHWTLVLLGTWHCMALPTFGAFCIIKDFAALPAVLLGLCSPGLSF